MNKSQPFHPLIYDYLKKYQEDPSSRVFAPLAEIYRKSGFLEESIAIARAGVKLHPHFMGGKVVLGRALFDQKKYSEVIEELAPIARDMPDNLVAQKLLAESYLLLGKVTEALDSYKLLLFFNPQDKEVANIVQELEAQSYEKNSLILDADRFNIKSASLAVQEDPKIKKEKKILKIEKLQFFLQKIERYKVIQEMKSKYQSGAEV